MYKKVFQRFQRSKGEIESERREILSERELEVVKLGSEGFRKKEIARTLSLSEQMVQMHWRSIFAKAGVSSRVEAIVYCLKNGFLSMNRNGNSGDV